MVRTDKSLRDTGELYAPAAFTYDADNFLVTAERYPGTATATVACRLWPKTDIDVPEPMGRSPRDIMDTTDILVLKNSETCYAGWYFKLTTSGHPDTGQFYKILGNAQNLTWRAGTRRFLMKKETSPPRS